MSASPFPFNAGKVGVFFGVGGWVGKKIWLQYYKMGGVSRPPKSIIQFIGNPYTGITE